MEERGEEMLDFFLADSDIGMTFGRLFEGEAITMLQLLEDLPTLTTSPTNSQLAGGVAFIKSAAWMRRMCRGSLADLGAILESCFKDL